MQYSSYLVWPWKVALQAILPAEIAQVHEAIEYYSQTLEEMSTTLSVWSNVAAIAQQNFTEQLR